LDIYSHPERARDMGENGRRFIHEKAYIRSEQARALAQILEELVCDNAA
jgi:hypothetical protein